MCQNRHSENQTWLKICNQVHGKAQERAGKRECVGRFVEEPLSRSSQKALMAKKKGFFFPLFSPLALSKNSFPPCVQHKDSGARGTRTESERTVERERDMKLET